MFAVSDFVSANWVLIILVAAFLVVGGRIALAQPAVRRQWDRMQLHAPVIGKLNQKICTARFARTLSNLYSSGVPIGSYVDCQPRRRGQPLDHQPV